MVGGCDGRCGRGFDCRWRRQARSRPDVACRRFQAHLRLRLSARLSVMPRPVISLPVHASACQVSGCRVSACRVAARRAFACHASARSHHYPFTPLRARALAWHQELAPVARSVREGPSNCVLVQPHVCAATCSYACVLVRLRARATVCSCDCALARLCARATVCSCDCALARVRVRATKSRAAACPRLHVASSALTPRA